MAAGLYNFETVAAYFGVKRTGLQQMIDEDGLPAIKIARAKIVKQKFSVTMLASWMRKKSGSPLTVDELRAELDNVEARREALADMEDEDHG